MIDFCKEKQIACGTNKNDETFFNLKYPFFFFVSFFFSYFMMLTSDENQPVSKKVPKVDFSLFTMADGAVVSTKERVVKGKIVFQITKY